MPASAAGWAETLPPGTPLAPVPPAVDPASTAAAAGMADWPALHELRASELDGHAAKLVGAAGTTDAVLDGSDQTNASSLTSTAPGMVAEVVGAVMGAGTGLFGQLASAAQGLVSAPVQALESLTSGLGSSSGVPTLAHHARASVPAAAGDLGSDVGAGATVPAGAGPAPSSVASSAVPVSAASPAAALSGAPPAVAAVPAGVTPGAGTGGMGMMPPMMGGAGGRPDGPGRDGGDRRAVLRPTPNSEPVFGELERRRGRRTK